MNNNDVTLPNGWVWANISEIADKVNPGFPSGQHNKVSAGVPHLRPMNVSKKGEIELAVLKYVTPPGNYDRLRGGDVLFNNTNSPELEAV